MKLTSVSWTLAVLFLMASATLAATDVTDAKLSQPGDRAANGAPLSKSPDAGTRCTADFFQVDLPALSPIPSPLAFTPCGSCSIPDCIGGVSGKTTCTFGFVKGRCILSPKLCLPNRTPQCICSASL
jgi:hypothetical protein